LNAKDAKENLTQLLGYQQAHARLSVALLPGVLCALGGQSAL